MSKIISYDILTLLKVVLHTNNEELLRQSTVTLLPNVVPEDVVPMSNDPQANDDVSEYTAINVVNEEAPTSAYQKLKTRMSSIVMSLPLAKAKNYSQVPDIEMNNNNNNDKSDRGRHHGKNNSRLELSSLQAVVRKLHLSYLVGMIFLIISLLLVFIVSCRTVCENFV